MSWNEPGFVQWLQRITKVSIGGMTLGIGDDCAIVRGTARAEDWLFTTDMLVESVHFERSTHTAADVGWKALARGLSDIAAMGGTPKFCLLSLAMAEWTDRRWIAGFYRGLLAHGVPLAGGDLARTDRVMADIVVVGAAPKGWCRFSSPCLPPVRVNGNEHHVERIAGNAGALHVELRQHADRGRAHDRGRIVGSDGAYHSAFRVYLDDLPVGNVGVPSEHEMNLHGLLRWMGWARSNPHSLQAFVPLSFRT